MKLLLVLLASTVVFAGPPANPCKAESGQALPECISKFINADGDLMEGNGNTCVRRLINGQAKAGKLSIDTLISRAKTMVANNQCKGEVRWMQWFSKGNCEVSTQEVAAVYQEVDYDDEHTLIVTNAIPNHCYQNGQEFANPNMACEHYRAMLVPKGGSGKGSTYIESAMGPVGITKSGAFLYNHKSAEADCNAAAITEKPNMDTCDGHADPNNHYHYHSTPNHICVTGTDSCGHVGYLVDGVEVRGNCTLIINGAEVPLKSCYKKIDPSANGCDTSMYEYDPNLAGCNLDEANGYLFSADTETTSGETFPAGKYAYFFTPNYPFLMPGHFGDPVPWCMVSAM